jgi:hypothetical protein
MKKISILIISLIFCQCLMAQKNIIKLNPFGLTYGKYNLQYERMLTDYTSTSISCSYIHPNIPNMEFITSLLEDIGIETSFGGVAFELDYRMYSKNKPGPQGFYIGPYIRYTGMGISAQVDELSFPLADNSIDHVKTGFYGMRTGLGVKFGAQWLLWNCVTIDWNFFGLGADYYLLKVYSEGTETKNGMTYSKQDVEKTQFFWPGLNSDFSVSYAF